MEDSLNQHQGNFAKYYWIFFETVTKVLVKTLKWLNVGQAPIQERIVDILQNHSRKFTSKEKNILEEVKISKIAIEDLDLYLLFKIIQTACGLAPESDTVWTHLCPLDKQVELEYLLMKLKDGLKNLPHPIGCILNLPKSDVMDKCQEMKQHLSSILQKAAKKSKINDEEVNDAVSILEGDIERIFQIDQYDLPTIKTVILNDLEAFAEVARALGGEGYSFPRLTKKDDQEAEICLQDLLTNDNSQVIAVIGESGIGKSALTRFLLDTWKFGDVNLIKELTAFDFVFRIECKHIHSKEVSQFFEARLPISSYLFLNSTSSVKKYLSGRRILWIMDGYDECTAEFKAFMKALTKSLPACHKLLVSTCSNYYEDLQKTLSGLTMSAFSLELLTDKNTEDIVSYIIRNDDTRKSFKKEIGLLGKVSKSLIRLPLNLTLLAELWLDDPALTKAPFTIKTLCVKCTNLHLKRLVGNLKNTIPPSVDGAERKITLWFYGSLCKESFLAAIRWDNILNSKAVESLKNDAIKAGLLTSDCLSAFLEETKGIDGKSSYDFKHSQQQYVLACLFLQNMKEYSDTPMIEIISNAQVYPALQLLKFYIEFAIEDDSINSNTTGIFNPILELSRLFKPREQNYIWCSTSVTSKFNKHFMTLISNTLMDVPKLDTSIFDTNLERAQFLKFVHPKNVRIRCSNTLEAQEREEFLILLEVLKDKQINIHLHTIFEEIDDIRGTSAIDVINETSLKITSLTGTMAEFPLLENHYENLETLELMIYSQKELLELCELLPDCESLKEIQLYLVFDSFSSTAPDSEFPRELLTKTTISFRRLTEDNFDNFFSFITEVKNDKSLKFKALFHCMDQISENHKKLLDEVASMVVFERCPYSKSLSRSGEFQIYTFPVEFHEVQTWKFCYQTHRNRELATISQCP